MFVETKVDAHVFWTALMNEYLQYQRLLYILCSSASKSVPRLCSCRYVLCRNIDSYG